MTPHAEFETLLERHWGIVCKVASVYASTWDERDDLAQEICLQLWRSFPRYDATRVFSTWMYRVALNTAISYARRMRHRIKDTIEIGEISSAGQTPDERSEHVEMLYRFIQRLDELTRALVLLHLEDHSHREIAEILGISETNVSTRLSRFRQDAKRAMVGTAKKEKGRYGA